jgi:hypothetical protein
MDKNGPQLTWNPEWDSYGQKWARFCEWDSHNLEMQTWEDHEHQGRIKLIGALNGVRYAWPGVGTAPDFLVPVEIFRAEQIVGQLLAPLAVSADGTLDVQWLEPQHTLVLSSQPVSCLTKLRGPVDDSELQPYSYGHLNRVVANDNTVGVMFGPQEIKVPGVDKELLNLDEVHTPWFNR